VVVFWHAHHNPFAYKPKGFMTGAGHGCTFLDRFDNLWHMGTMKISLRRGFERRVALYPAGFDEDGVLFCSTRFGDYPMNVPAAKWDPVADSFAGLMLLSLNKPVTASSVRDDHVARHAMKNTGSR
jgi:xylan 1,4-beta-xylosidase